MKSNSHIWNTIAKKEYLLYYLSCIVALLPLVANTYYLTLDGPAHTYNAVIINSLVLEGDPGFRQFFQINNFPVPNWFSQGSMAILQLFVSAWVSEKVIQLFYFLSFLLFFRKSIEKISPTNKFISYFALLFVHHYLFFYGFYNMCIGISFLLIGIYYQLRSKTIKNIRAYFLWTFLILLFTYFAHIMVYLISVSVQLGIILSTINFKEIWHPRRIPKRINQRLIIVVLAAFPTLVLSVIYFAKIDSVEGAVRLPINELLNWFISVRPLITVCDCPEWLIPARIVFGLILLLLGSFLFLKLKKSKNGDQLQIINLRILTGLLSLGFLGLFFLLPNAILLSERLILFFFLSLIFFLATLHYQSIIKWTAICILLVIHIFLVVQHINKLNPLSNQVESIKNATTFLPQPGTILTLNYSDSWINEHIGSYAGCQGKVVLENYSAGLDWFPVQWTTDNYQINELKRYGVDNKDIACNFFLPEASPHSFRISKTGGQISPISYVLIIRPDLMDRKDDCQNEILEILESNYQLWDKNNFCTIYQLNRSNN